LIPPTLDIIGAVTNMLLTIGALTNTSLTIGTVTGASLTASLAPDVPLMSKAIRRHRLQS
jgi:hypothetical protein